MEVQVHTRKMIKPLTPTPHHLRELKLSCFDQIAPPAFGSFIYFFPADNCISTGCSLDGRIEKLENSLSEVLTSFYPMAGRFVEDRNAIDCSDQGVEYLEARVINANISQFILEEIDLNLVNHLVPLREFDFTPAMLGVQINKFDCSGLAVAVSFSHKLADGFTIFSFMNGWATACRVGLDKVKCLSFETGSVLPATCPAKHTKHIIPLPDDITEKLVTRRFIFSEAAISALKSKAVAMAVNSGLGSLQPSRVQLVMALMWKARLAVSQAKHGSLRSSLHIFPFNFRGRTTIPLPPNAAGNLFRSVNVRFTANDKKLDWHHLVNLVGDGVRQAAEFCAKTEQAEDLLLCSINCLREIREELNKGNTDLFVLTSVCKFPMYEADFGWGKPAWIASVHKPAEFMMLMDTRCGTGIEAWMTLEPADMLQFRQDPDILTYTCKPAEFYSTN